MLIEIHISLATQKRAMSVTSKVSDFRLFSIDRNLHERQKKKNNNKNINNNNNNNNNNGNLPQKNDKK